MPSFYALDVMRAAMGHIPDYEWLEARARDAGNATLAWPAPPRPEDAIDDQEHDLAVLRVLLDEKDREAVKGHAHYLLKLNECLRRSVIDRWARGEARWSVNDGLTRVSNDTRGGAGRAAAHGPALLAVGAAALQRVPVSVRAWRDVPSPAARAARAAQHMDPLTRGSLFHEIQAQFFRALRERQALPVTEARVDEAHIVLDAAAGRVAARAYDELAPAVDRVWNDAIASIRRDLHGWLHVLARMGTNGCRRCSSSGSARFLASAMPAACRTRWSFLVDSFCEVRSI